MKPRLVAVAVPVPSLEPLTYRVPEGVTPGRGVRVLVPVGRRTLTGCVLDVLDTAGTQAAAGGSHGDLREVLEVIDDQPLLPPSVLDLALWVADYYLCSVGEALGAALPPFAWVQSRPSLRLTSAGRARLELGAGESLERLALRVIGRREPVTRAALVPALLRAAADDRVLAGPSASAPERAALPGLDSTPRRARQLAAANVRHVAGGASGSARRQIDAVLDRLVRLGLVAREHALPGRRPGFRTVRGATLSPSAADLSSGARLPPKQRAALEVLRAAGGGLDVPALAARGVTPAVLAGLERRGLVLMSRRRVDRDPSPPDAVPCEPQGVSAPNRSWPSMEGNADWQAAAGRREAEKAGVTLTVEQQAALDRLNALAALGGFRVALLHGVTGSGKTEVYRRLAAKVREAGRPVLMLVPEIALTPALAATFRHTFGERVAIQHSALSAGERHDQWHRIRRGEVDVVVGTRSAVFAPLASPGLVIVDEEHDTSYKQEEAPRYHGRDVAIVRGRDAGALVVLGSATPALETYQNALAGRYERIAMSRRVLDRPMADVRIVDMREEYAAEGPDVVLSRVLRERLADRLSRGEQAIVLLNRRGYARAMFCRQCADALDCPNCSVSLTVHRAARQARCHYCDFSQRVPERCVKCGGEYLEYVGIGTERVESEIAAAFPGVRVTRVDRDTVRRRGEITRVLRGFARRELDVLVGTQMLAKGHDFPAVTLVGVISADVGLGLADFRAAERTFQLLTQVAGRAGRGDLPGEAIIQTLYPRHYSIVHARAQDYAAFFADEIAYRRAMRHPPAVSLVNVIVRGRTTREAHTEAAGLARALRATAPAGVRVLGPAPAPLERLRGEHRAQLFLKSSGRRAMREALRRVLAGHPRLARHVTIDVDPLSVL